MARPLRIQDEGLFYHVTTRGNRGQPIYLSAADRLDFLARLRKAHDRYELEVIAHCLMGNHYHLLVRTPCANISRIMQWLNGSYAQSFNWHNGFENHLFGERFHSVLIEDDDQLKACARYVVRNPVRAGICAEAAEWQWSSFLATVGLAPRPKFLKPDILLGLFSPNEQRARARFGAFVNDQLLPERPEFLLSKRDMSRV